MFQNTISQDRREVQITANSASGPFSSRLYVNGGETPTLVTAKHKSLSGAVAWAKKVVAQ